MTATPDMAAVVAELIGRVTADAAIPRDKVVHEVIAGLRRSPPFTEVRPFTFRALEVQVQVGLTAGLGDELEGLKRVGDLGLAIAPEIVSCVAVDEKNSALTTRYAACRGEELRPFLEKKDGPLLASAVRRCRAELEVLVGRGLVHRGARGGAQWLVAGTSGTLVLDGWDGVSVAKRREASDMMEAVETLFRWRGVAAEVA